jgi:glycosyltransferase involved in cell wall biosynthesis
MNIFFTPESFIHDKINKYKHIQKYCILYDVMPLVYPEYYPSDFSTNDHITEYACMRSLNRECYYFCISECTKRDYIKYYSNILEEKKIIITHIASAQIFYPIYNKLKLFVVFKKYKVEYKNNDKYIFSLCTLEPRKNLAFTVKCFVKFIKKHNIDNLYFYLGGGQWDKFIHLLEDRIDSFGEYRDKIVRLGYVDDKDVNILYSNSLFFTYISQYEGFGMPPLEAMQAGTPVITSNNSSLPEVVGDAAIMIDYDSEEQCIKAFEDLYFNEDLRKHYIEKGLERSKIFSWEKTVDKMEKAIFENIS